MTRILAVCAASFLFSPCRAEAVAQTTYQFIKIADTTGQFNSFETYAINVGGVVAFNATLDGGGEGVFASSGGPVTTIADTLGAFTDVEGASINDAGFVAFRGVTQVANGIYVGDGGPVDTIADSSGPFATLRGPSINNVGSVAFSGVLDSMPFEEGIFVANGGLTTPIADTSGPLEGVGLPHINDAGLVVFEARLDGIPPMAGIYTGSGGDLTPIAEGNFVEPLPRLNDSGNVVLSWTGSAPSGPGIYSGNGGTPDLYVGASGPFAAFGASPDINDAGSIVFAASLDSGGGGLYTGPNPATGRVIELGNALFGSTLTDLDGFSRLNNRGDVVFEYTLASGVSGIALAREIPEPAGFALLIASSAAWSLLNAHVRLLEKRHGAVSAAYVSGRRSR